LRKEETLDKRKARCYNCKKCWHYADECQHGREKKGQKNEKEANMAQDDDFD